MKHLYTLIFLLLVSTNIIAQEREILPVNWKQIKEDVNKDPQKVKDLVARLSATSLDTTLTYQDRILAFYGQSFLTNDEEEKLKIKMYDQKDKGHITESLETAKKILEINPLNLEALNHAGQILYAMASDSTSNSGITKEDAKSYFNRAMRIFNTITPVLSQLVKEIRRSFDYYERQFNGTVDCILLSGGSAKFENIDSYISNELGIKCSIINPFRKIDISKVPGYDRETLEELAPSLTVALGLALRSFV